MRRRVGEQVDDLHLLDHRAGPSVAEDERQRVLVLGANVDEVDVQPVDLGDEVGHRVEPGLALAPVVLPQPIARDRLDRRQLHALRRIVDGLLLGPARGRDTSTHVVEIRLGELDRERPDGGLASSRFDRDSHVWPPRWKAPGRDDTEPDRCVCTGARGGPWSAAWALASGAEGERRPTLRAPTPWRQRTRMRSVRGVRSCFVRTDAVPSQAGSAARARWPPTSPAPTIAPPADTAMVSASNTGATLSRRVPGCGRASMGMC